MIRRLFRSEASKAAARIRGRMLAQQWIHDIKRERQMTVMEWEQRCIAMTAIESTWQVA